MRPVNSIKHIVDQQGTNAPDVKQDVVIAIADDNPSTALSTQVQSGCRISSIFLNVQIVNETDAVGTVNNCYFIIYKNPGNNITQANIPNANETGISDFRKQIFHTEMTMLSDANDSIPITLFKGVLRIPPRFQRMGINDQIRLQIFQPVGGATVNFCVESIYKEFR